ncbi:MAG: sulfite exporter TauE/SafE family protein [Patescibacteria group bacterium]|nr:sulfite exporter TauE/SafE family protein [Patescibacteria group bacterium]
MTLLADPLSLAPAAFIAGILMFLAPCTLPIVPGYLAFIAGTPEGGRARFRVFYNALAFVVGFTLIFVLFGTFAALLGGSIGLWRYTLSRLAGLLLILFGLTMLGIFRLPVLSGTWQTRMPRFLSLGHPQSSFIMGALFALGWSPCIGPILGTILFLASASTTAAQGALLLFIFSLGLSLPFLLFALLLDRGARLVSHLGRTALLLQWIGGCILIFLGILMVLGDMGLLVTWGFGLFGGIGYDRLLNFM